MTDPVHMAIYLGNARIVLTMSSALAQQCASDQSLREFVCDYVGKQAMRLLTETKLNG